MLNWQPSWILSIANWFTSYNKCRIVFLVNENNEIDSQFIAESLLEHVIRQLVYDKMLNWWPSWIFSITISLMFKINIELTSLAMKTMKLTPHLLL